MPLLAGSLKMALLFKFFFLVMLGTFTYCFEIYDLSMLKLTLKKNYFYSCFVFINPLISDRYYLAKVDFIVSDYSRHEDIS